MKYILTLCVLAVAACSSCASGLNSVRAKYVNQAAYVEAESSVRITVTCNDPALIFGSGTAISNDTVITAKHVVDGCDDYGGAASYSITTMDGESHLALVDTRLEVDIATLITLEDAPFTVIPKIAQEEPLIGERLCWEGGDADPEANGLRKCGDYSGKSWKSYKLVSGKGAHGNSGAGVFNERGELVGVLNIGDDDPAHDFLIGYTPAKVWAQLVEATWPD